VKENKEEFKKTADDGDEMFRDLMQEIEERPEFHWSSTEGSIARLSLGKDRRLEEDMKIVPNINLSLVI
jgi:hypothetical protein